MPFHSFKSFLKLLIPPLVVSIANYSSRRLITFEGSFPCWRDALSLSSGYDSHAILRSVLNSTLLVAHGEAEYERDSVIFDSIQYSWPLLAGLLLAAARAKGRLRVLDFGGSLGSTFFQNRRFLAHLSSVNWCVIEQPHFVQAGLDHILDSQLTFSDNLDQYLSDNLPNVSLFSGVLQVIEDPWSILDMILQAKSDVVIIDRTPYVFDGHQERISIQRVPSTIYPASYPCRFFVERDMVDFIESRGYRLLECFDAVDDLDSNAAWKGHVFLHV